MTTVNMHDAKSQLSKLVEAVESGASDEIVIARNGRPAARLVPMAGSGRAPVRIGIARSLFVAPADPQADDAEVAALVLGDGA
jgi:prevent-host-death family protein